MKRDYYEILGISRESSVREIKKAYKRLARQFHPDRNPGNPSAEEKFKEASEAYAILGDQEKRALYDRFGHSAVKGFTPQGSGYDWVFRDFEDIFDDFFGFGDLFGFRGRRARRRTRQGADLSYALSLTLEEAAHGVEKKIKIPKRVACEECGGSGSASGRLDPCQVCSGTGKVTERRGFFHITQTCPKCRGEGMFCSSPCQICQGDGRVNETKRVLLRVPPGMEDGSRLRLTGEGESGFRGDLAGDLYVEIKVVEHPVFQRRGNDIYCDVPISFPQAALGSTLEVPTLDGPETLKIPPATQSGDIFRLEKRGIRSAGRRGIGDQYVTVQVKTPEKLTREQQKLLRRLAETLDAQVEPEQWALFNRAKDRSG